MAEHVTDAWRNATVDYTALIAEERLPGYEMIYRFATSNDIDMGEYVVLSNLQALVHFIASERQMTVRCANAADHSAGTGARKLLLVYLDDEGEEKSEVITLEADLTTNTVATDIYRIVSLHVIEYGNAGGYGVGGASGDIMLTNLGNTETYAKIDQYQGGSEAIIYWIRPGYRFVFSGIQVQCSNEGAGADMGIFITKDLSAIGGGTNVTVQLVVLDFAWGNAGIIDPKPTMSYYNDSDYIQCIYFGARAIAADNIRGSGSFVGYEFQPDY